MLFDRETIRRLFSVAALALVCVWSAPASATVCSMGGFASKIVTIPPAMAAGIPAFFAPEGSAMVAGGPSAAGPRREYDGGRDPASLALFGTIEGRWGRWGYRTDWYNFQRGAGCNPWWAAHGSAAGTYRIASWESTRLYGSLGAGYSVGLGPSLDAGIALETEPIRDLGVEARLRYLPHFVSSYDGSRVAHGLRGRLRVEWIVASAFQPFVGVTGGRTGYPDGAYYAARERESSVTDGLYVSGVAGIEAAWGQN